MNEAILRELQRLGAVVHPPVSDAYVVSSHSWAVLGTSKSWRGADPREQLTTYPPALRAFVAVEWPERGLQLREDADEPPVPFEPAMFSENWDMKGADGQRALMLFIGWNPATQFLYGLDALDTSDDPAVYRTDHDASDPASLAFPRLSEFLAALGR